MLETAQAETYSDDDDKWWQWDWVDDALNNDWEAELKWKENCSGDLEAYIVCNAGNYDECEEYNN